MSALTELYDADRLLSLCKKLDGQGYGAIFALYGLYDLGDGLRMAVEYLPRRPQKEPGKIRLMVSYSLLGVDGNTVRRSKFWSLAVKQYVAEHIYRSLRYEGRPWLWLEPPGQAILERTSVELHDSELHILLDFIPPTKGRNRISGNRMRRLFTETVPRIVGSLKPTSKGRKLIEDMVAVLEDRDVLVKKLCEEGFVAFIASGSILPRQGNTDMPLKGAKPFRAPPEAEYEFRVPHAGTIRGLAIERGKVVTFAGANFHGKTTILEALMVGHYAHVPGDGREFVVTVGELPLVAAENRRIVRGVDISLFMKQIPGGGRTDSFTTNEASGSTSQAATFMEALEARVPGILIDEDSSAVNFLLKDNVLQRLVPADLEPIKPLVLVMKDIVRSRGLTIIFAVGALGKIVEESDVVYLVSNYEVVAKVERKDEGGAEKHGMQSRVFELRERIVAPIPRHLTVRDYSYDEIELNVSGRRTSVSLRGPVRKTLKERAQVRALAYAIAYAGRYMDGKRSIYDVVSLVFRDIENEGLNVLNPRREEYVANLAMPTKYQLFYALSRLRVLRATGYRRM